MGYRSKFTGEQIDALLEKAGQGGGIPNYEIDGDTSPLYCLIEGELAEKIYNGDALKASEAESFFEKMNNAWLTLIKFPDSPLLLVYNLVGFDTDLTFFSIGNAGIDTSGELWGSIITFTKNGSVYELSTNYYPAE